MLFVLQLSTALLRPLLGWALPLGTELPQFITAPARRRGARKCAVLRSVTLGSRGCKGLNMAFMTGAHPSSQSGLLQPLELGELSLLAHGSSALRGRQGSRGWSPLCSIQEHLLPQFFTSSCDVAQGREELCFPSDFCHSSEQKQSSVFHGSMAAIRATDLMVL